MEVTEREMRILRDEVAAMRLEHGQIRPDLERLRRALWGEGNGRSAYKGFFHDFDIFRQSTHKEFENIRGEIKDVRNKLDLVSNTTEGLLHEKDLAKSRGERLSKWALILVPLIILAILNLLTNILQSVAVNW
jgi:hypothetical protein